MEAVGCSHEIEEVAVLAGGEKQSLGSELLPCHPLASQEKRAQDGCPNEPRSSAANSGTSQAEPFFHDINFVKKMATRHFHRQTAKEQNSRIDPENGRNRQRMPVGNVVVANIEVSGILADKEGTHQSDKEDQIACESEEKAEPVAGEEFTRAAPSVWVVVPIVVAASAACRPSIYGRFAPDSSVFPLDIGRGTGEGSGHGAIPSANSLLLFLLDGTLHDRLQYISIKTVFVRTVADSALY